MSLSSKPALVPAGTGGLPLPMNASLSPTTDSLTASEGTTTFLSLPAEIRLQVYGLLLTEILIENFPDSGRPYPPGVRRISPDWAFDNGSYYEPINYSITPRLGFLFVSKTVHREVKHYIDTLPVVMSGFSHNTLIPFNLFPVGMFSRVHQVTIQSPSFACFDEKLYLDRAAWIYSRRFQNLRTIHVEPSPGTGGPYFGFEFRLAGIVSEWLSHERTHDHLSTVTGVGTENLNALLRDMTSPRGTPAGAIRTRNAIQSRHLTLKSHFQVYLSNGKGPRRQILCEQFRITITWDESGIRIEDLPDLRDEWWWNLCAEQSADLRPVVFANFGSVSATRGAILVAP